MEIKKKNQQLDSGCILKIVPVGYERKRGDEDACTLVVRAARMLNF